MSKKIVSNLKDSVSSLLSGMDLSTVNYQIAFERAANVMTAKAYIPEASAKQMITLYSGVYDYACDERIYGTKIRDIKPLGVQRSTLSYVYKKAEDDFDRNKQTFANGTSVAFDSVDGTPIIRIVSSEVKQGANLDSMNDTTGWAISGTGSSLTLDTTVCWKRPASLRFNATTGAAILTKTIQSSNLSVYEGVGVVFLPVFMPDSSLMTNCILRIGSNSSNYYEVTQTTGFLNTKISNDFFLMAFDLSTATKVGTPNMAAVTYISPRFTASSAMNNIRFGGLWISLPYPSQVYFQTSAFFHETGQETSSSISTDADEIILNISAYTIYQYECALAVLQQTGGATADSSVDSIKEILDGVHTGNNSLVKQGLYDWYRGDNPSQELRTIGNYYE